MADYVLLCRPGLVQGQECHTMLALVHVRHPITGYFPSKRVVCRVRCVELAGYLHMRRET